MMEPAIYCGKKALFYCKIAPTSKYGLANSLYQVGNLYDMSNITDSASYYYKQAIEALPDSNNLVYRNIITSKALLAYNSGCDADSLLVELKQITKHIDNIDEISTRFVIIGYIYYKEKVYDSAVIYLEKAVDNNITIAAKHQSAEYLYNLNLQNGDSIKAYKYANFLAENATRQYDNMAKVSLLDNIFYDYVKRHQSETSPNRKNKHITFIIIAIVAATTIIYIIYRRKRKEIEDKKDDNLKLMVENQRLKKYLGSKENKNFVSLRKVAIAIYNEQRNNSLEHILKVFDSYYPKVSDELTNKFTNLSKTEHDLVILSFIGFRIKEEAEILGISENTVGKYRSNIRKKAGKTPVFDIL
ncbi:MAG: hypothetical protein IJT45_06995 [Bacteroidales bacterium]|nr:hypothetical protein [Bacteroidales bacterium]